ncbi:MAG: putative glycoside hydrolase, partial [Candidatus Kapaibacteriota bacterium]
WVKIATVVNDTMEIPYGFPVELRYEEGIPICLPSELKLEKLSGQSKFIAKIKFVSKYFPDSIYFYADLNKSNNFENYELTVVPSQVDIFVYEKLLDQLINAGVECYTVCFKGGKSYRYPRVGYWTTNPNNRVKNENYNFFVMNVTSEKWRKNYISQVLNAFTKGYNGLFADDTWHGVYSWGVDSYPIWNYSHDTWLDAVYNCLLALKDTIKDKPVYFNGLFDVRAYKFLEVSDGGMTEGFVHNHWSGFSTEIRWIRECQFGIDTRKLGKHWLPLGGVIDNSPEPRLYTISSYYLVSWENSFFGNTTTYQVIGHYPEFDIPLGKPLVTAQDSILELKKIDKYGKAYYSREFENFLVFVNPSRRDTVYLPELAEKFQLMVDSFPTIAGGRLFTIRSDTVLKPLSSKIILKGTSDVPKLCSPSLRNPKINISSYNDEELRVEVSVECADSSSKEFTTNENLPLYVYADLISLGLNQELILSNDGTPAGVEFKIYSGEARIPGGANLKYVSIPIIAMSTTGLMAMTYATIEISNVDTSNLIPNFSFEFDVNSDGIPDFWKPYKNNFEYDTSGLNAQHLKRSVKVHNSNEQDAGGVYTTIKLNQLEPKPILVAGWSKAENVSGTKDNDYSIYADFFANDGTPWYARTSKFNTGTHDWEYSGTIYLPQKPIEKGNVYCLFRKHSGTVWFDNIFVGEVDTTATLVDEFKAISINVPSFVSGKDDDVLIISTVQRLNGNLSIFDLVGNKLYSPRVDFSEKTIVPLMHLTTRFSTGTYFLKIEVDEKIYVFPFLLLR